MTQRVSRRSFLATASAALLASQIPRSATPTQVPTLLDHILLGCDDLDRGIAFVEEQTGVRAVFGGVHPGRGTQNALLSLGERRYLEIIAPDPKQDAATSRFADLVNLSEPRLIGWAVHPVAIGALAKRLTDHSIAHTGPTDGSRRRPDGTTLHWATVNLTDDQHGLLPFFIAWSEGSLHPSLGAPQGCRLTKFAAFARDAEKLGVVFGQLDVDVTVERDERPHLRAEIEGPKGKFEVTS